MVDQYLWVLLVLLTLPLVTTLVFRPAPGAGTAAPGADASLAAVDGGNPALAAGALRALQAVLGQDRGAAHHIEHHTP